MSGFPHYGKYADFRTLVIAWALLRLWRIRIGPEHCEVERWRGTVGDDGILLCDGESVDGGQAGECVGMWESDDHIPYGHVPCTDKDVDLLLPDLEQVRDFYFISKGLEALLVHSHSVTAAATDWENFHGRNAPLTWYSFTQGLPDADVFRLMWWSKKVHTGAQKELDHEVTVIPGWGTECNQRHAHNWSLFKFPATAEAAGTSDPITAGNARGKEAMDRGVDENFPGGYVYMLNRLLHRGNLVGIMANVAPAVHGGAPGAPLYYSPFVGVFHHPDRTKYRYLNNTAWELQGGWADNIAKGSYPRYYGTPDGCWT